MTDQPTDKTRRAKITLAALAALAALAGLISGATRAVTAWVLAHLTSHP